MAPLACPCGLDTYARCCGRWHGAPGGLDLAPPAPDAVTLMRSRYSAYALGRADYVLATWHPTTRPGRIEMPAGLRWLGLTVRAQAQTDADHASVAFVARSRQGGGLAHRLVETSRFVREAGRWWYLDGDVQDG